MLQPAAVFRMALYEAAAKERSARRTRQDRVRAIAGLAEDDLARLAEVFEALLRSDDEADRIATRLHAALRELSPEELSGEDESDA